MSISGIQGHLLEVTVVGCFKLKDTEWISRQDPYVCLEYANTKYRTRTCTDGGKDPVFQEKFVFTLIEGLREINLSVWNSNTLTFDDFIGSGKAQIQDVLLRGYDDRPWPLQTKTGRYAGEVKLIMHYANANKPDHIGFASAPPYPTTHQPQTPMHSAPSAYQPPQRAIILLHHILVLHHIRIHPTQLHSHPILTLHQTIRQHIRLLLTRPHLQYILLHHIHLQPILLCRIRHLVQLICLQAITLEHIHRHRTENQHPPVVKLTSNYLQDCPVQYPKCGLEQL